MQPGNGPGPSLEIIAVRSLWKIIAFSTTSVKHWTDTEHFDKAECFDEGIVN